MSSVTGIPRPRSLARPPGRGGVARATFDFFEAQRSARRRTALLLLYYLLSIPGVAALVYVAVWLGLALSPFRTPLDSPSLAWSVLLGVALAIGAGTLHHHAALASGGGERVARSLGGEPLALAPQAEEERRLRNVVEELAIAAGLPVPSVWILRSEPGVNAFAAGFAPDRAVLGVTQGALLKLDRDELQGVVAHELSHVRSGDMRLNLRLMALAGGLSSVALVGRLLLQAGTRRPGAGRRGGVAQLAFAGLALMAAGSAGELFARLVRAAVARQREYHADAAAAQFTRDPAGLAGALRKVLEEGAALASARAPEASHLLFASGRPSRWLADHPPPARRIRRLLALPEDAPLPAPRPRPAAPAHPPPLPPLPASALPPPLPPLPLAAAIEAPLATLPPELAAAAHEPFGASALACALLLDPRPDVRARQLALLGGAEAHEAGRLAPLVADPGPGRDRRLALLDLALPALGALSAPQREGLRADLRRLAGADGRTTVSEWVYLRVVGRRLARLGTAGRPARTRAFVLDQVAVECRELLGLLARAGAEDEAGAQAALDAGVAALGLRAAWRLPPASAVGPARLDRILEVLEACAPGVRARILAAAEACVAADGRATGPEAELLRAIADTLAVPLPPEM